MLSITYLAGMIRQWAVARNIVDGATQKDQALKLQSEFGELCGNVDLLSNPYLLVSDRNDLLKKVVDDIGDNFVVLTILAAQQKEQIETIEVGYYDGSCDHVYKLGQVYGKLCDSVLKGDSKSVSECIGLAHYHLRELSDELDLQFQTCIAEAYKDIKDRRGIMYNGAFIKSTDSRYLACCEEIGVQP